MNAREAKREVCLWAALCLSREEPACLGNVMDYRAGDCVKERSQADYERMRDAWEELRSELFRRAGRH